MLTDNQIEQVELERKYSRSYAMSKVKDLLKDKYAQKVKVFGGAIDEMLSTEYDYQPKTQRCMETIEYWTEREVTSEDIFCEVITSSVYASGSTLQALVGRLAYLTNLTYKDSCTTMGEIVSLCSLSGLFTLSKETSTGMRMVDSKIDMPDYMIEMIARTAYLPPMLVPAKARSNDNAGWLSHKKSVFLNDAHHNGKAPLEYLSILGSFPFAVDKHMLKYDEYDEWLQMDFDIDDEKQFTAMKNKFVLRKLTIRTIKELLGRGNKFYIPHRVDSRYRSYSAGYQLTPMGTDYRKALMSSATEVEITDNYNF